MPNAFSSFLGDCHNLLAAIDQPMAQAFLPLLNRAVEQPALDERAPFPLDDSTAWNEIANDETRPAVAALHLAMPAIPWRSPDASVVAPGWAHQAATAELIGPDGAIAPQTNERFGLLYLGTDTNYPDHWHNADEFYVVLAGEGEWTIDGTSTTVRAGGYSRTPSRANHRIVTRDQPVLTIFGWSGDTSYDSYEF